MSRITRRRFLQSTSVAAGGSLILTGTRASGAVDGANDRLRIAVAGLNGRGRSHIGGWKGQKNVEIAYVIDPDKRVLEGTANGLKNQFKDIKAVTDVREALDDKNLDAISVATPNHWHSLITIWAAQAGKHVYVEKPMSHDIAEGRVCVEAQKKYGVVIQHGTQQRSDGGAAGLTEAVKAGKWGKLKISYGYCCKPRGGIGIKSTSDAPSNLDWNLWRGPAEIDAYHGNFVHYNWHWFWKSGNGDLNNQGTHQLDRAVWAIDDDQLHPVRAMAIGGRFQWNDQGETPNSMFGIAEYPNGQFCYFNVRNVNYKGYQRQVENEFYFEDGGKIIRRRYYAPGSDKGEPISVPGGKITPGGNWGSFIAACRAGDPNMANGNVMDAHRGCVVGHLMNNSYRLGKKVPFNAKAGTFGDNKDAAEHFGRLHSVLQDGVGVKDGESYVVGPWLTFDPKTERNIGEYADEANALVKDANRSGFEIPDANKV
ncbi:MAG: Gfo/Idh/MocA family oxidoreductase [Pirellulales bacterium]